MHDLSIGSEEELVALDLLALQSSDYLLRVVHWPSTPGNGALRQRMPPVLAALPFYVLS
ncbi:hypothetical protein [Paraburkholderia diazotrophica]|uniref:Uncharacterized protein n=1 Tax=Paraburkholderia diazotrophica TaxID=667676 RepID=A0A1H7EF16_9BURK|nr:hypothetical protein [Paraburkholderia diazotrophica]SEK10642.1 hypothetical protein SAMN05192539_104854 [Paraburkholderia diazotrophica]